MHKLYSYPAYAYDVCVVHVENKWGIFHDFKPKVKLPNVKTAGKLLGVNGESIGVDVFYTHHNIADYDDPRLVTSKRLKCTRSHIMAPADCRKALGDWWTVDFNEKIMFCTRPMRRTENEGRCEVSVIGYFNNIGI